MKPTSLTDSIKRNTILAVMLISVLLAGCTGKGKPEYIVGADISFLPQMEARGVTYRDSGIEMGLFDILKKYHVNYIRLRIFHNPAAENGYSADGYCGLKQTMLMAKRIYQAGMGFALDFHYSDTWADPDKQYKPSAWAGVEGKLLEDSLYTYTKAVLIALKNQGTPPHMVQVGNEIINGMVWPDGKIEDTSGPEAWDAFTGLYNAGVKAVREVLPEAQVMLHLALGGQNMRSRLILDNVLSRNAEFDILGQSYYPQWHGTYIDLKNNLEDLVVRYGRPILVCEHTAPGIKEINDIVMSVPGNMGIGTMIWEPTRRLIFDREGNTNENILDYLAVNRNVEAWQKGTFKLPDVFTVPETGIFDEPVIGADVSWVQEHEDKGMVYSDGGVEKEVFEILKDYKFNWIRFRLFVDPTAENGYSAEGYCDLENTLIMAKRVKAQGMKLLLNFHYSDNWADPGKQFTPAAWSSITSSANMERTIYEYTRNVIERFRDEGVTPEMVQVGNEINNGFLWPFGRNDESWTHFAGSLRVASAAVRSVDPGIKVMVHVALGGQNERSVKFFDKIIENDVVFDVIGQSYYPRWHGTIDDLKHNLEDLTVRYNKPVIVVEYSEMKQEVHEVIGALPAKTVPGSFIWEATSPRWGKLFDENGRTTEFIKLYPEIYNQLKTRQ